MELTAEEFVRRICSIGQPVSGAFVSGPVRLEDTVVRQTDWSECTFDSSIQLERCTLVAGPRRSGRHVNEVHRLQCLDLTGSRIAGGLRIRTSTLVYEAPPEHGRSFRPKGMPSRRTVALEWCLEAAAIEGDLELDGWSVQAGERQEVSAVRFDAGRCRVDGQVWITSLDAKGMSIVLARALVGRGVLVRGRFDALDLGYADVGSGVRVELAPRRPIGHPEAQHVPQALIDLRQIRIKGDLSVTPHHATSEPWSQGADEGIDFQAFEDPEHAPAPVGRICARVLAPRATVDRDVLIGRERSDYAQDDCVVELDWLDLSGIHVGGDLSVAGAILARFSAAEEDIRANSGLLLRDARAESVRLHSLDVDLDVATDLPAGERLSVLDLGGLRVTRTIDLVGVRGEAAASLPLNAVAVDLRQAECAKLLLQGVELQVPGEGAGMDLLAIDAAGMSVSGEVRLGKLDGGRGDPLVDLSEAGLGCLTLAEPLPEGRVHLTGARVGRWGMAPRDGLGDQESFNAYKRLLACADSLDVAQYVAVERRLAEIGKSRDADQMHVHWKRLERKRLLGYRRLASYLHDRFLGYGTQVWRPAVMLLVAFVLSTALLTVRHGQWLQVSDAKQAELADCGYRCIERWPHYRLPTDWPGRLGNAAAVTTKSLVPIVDLQLASHLDPVPQTMGSVWVSLLRVLGYVLWPIFLTGLVAQLLPQGRNPR